jgi:hypothetical protein
MGKLKACTLMVFGLSILFTLFFDFNKHASALGVANPFALDPYDAVGSLGIQLALLSALLMLIRAYRPYPQSGVPPAQFVLAMRSGTVVLLSVTVTLVADAIGLMRAILIGGASAVAWTLAGLLAGMALVTLASGWTFFRFMRFSESKFALPPWLRVRIIFGLAILILIFFPLTWRNSGVLGAICSALAGIVLLIVTVWGFATTIFTATTFEYEDIFDDLSAIFQGWKKRLGHLASPFTCVEKAAVLPQISGLLGWLNPRRHRWNLVIVAGLAMGLLLVIAETIIEGMSPNVGRVMLVIGVYLILEGSGVVLGYLFFGNYLGIFRAD